MSSSIESSQEEPSYEFFEKKSKNIIHCIIHYIMHCIIHTYHAGVFQTGSEQDYERRSKAITGFTISGLCFFKPPLQQCRIYSVLFIFADWKVDYS